MKSFRVLLRRFWDGSDISNLKVLGKSQTFLQKCLKVSSSYVVFFLIPNDVIGVHLGIGVIEGVPVLVLLLVRLVLITPNIMLHSNVDSDAGSVLMQIPNSHRK